MCDNIAVSVNFFCTQYLNSEEIVNKKTFLWVLASFLCILHNLQNIVTHTIIEERNVNEIVKPYDVKTVVIEERKKN